LHSITESIAGLVAEGYPEDVAMLLVKATMRKRRRSAFKNEKKRAEIREERLSKTHYPFAHATCAYPYKEW